MKNEENTSTTNENVDFVYSRFVKIEVWLYSKHFLKRAFAIAGYNLVAVTIVYFTILLFLLVFGSIYSVL